MVKSYALGLFDYNLLAILQINASRQAVNRRSVLADELSLEVVDIIDLTSVIARDYANGCRIRIDFQHTIHDSTGVPFKSESQLRKVKLRSSLNSGGLPKSYGIAILRLVTVGKNYRYGTIHREGIDADDSGVAAGRLNDIQRTSLRDVHILASEINLTSSGSSEHAHLQTTLDGVRGVGEGI